LHKDQFTFSYTYSDFHNFLFKIYYRTEAVVVDQNILKATVQCTPVKPTQQFERANPSLTQHKEWSLFIL